LPIVAALTGVFGLLQMTNSHEFFVPDVQDQLISQTTLADYPNSASRPARSQANELSRATGSEAESPRTDLPADVSARSGLTSPPATGGLHESVGSAPSLRTVFDDRFVDNRNGWPHDPQSTARVADGAYRLTARTPGRFVAVGAPIAHVFHDLEVYGAFRKVGGPPGGGYGLIVRYQGSPPGDGVQQGGRYYVLEVGDRGQLGVWRREEDHWVDLIPWTPSEAVRPGTAVNHLAVRAAGTQLAFLVNGAEVANVADAALAEGGVGIFVGGDFNDVVVERFVVQE
jgi:hypothetical protein